MSDQQQIDEFMMEVLQRVRQDLVEKAAHWVAGGDPVSRLKTHERLAQLVMDLQRMTALVEEAKPKMLERLGELKAAALEAAELKATELKAAEAEAELTAVLKAAAERSR